MAKKSNNLNRPQLRRCSGCQKMGHNLSRCSELKKELFPAITSSVVQKKTTPSEQPINQPIKKTPLPVNFFVHHVNVTPPQSRHIVDLKTPSHSVWDKIQSISAEQEPTYFQSYHTKNTSSDNFEATNENYNKQQRSPENRKPINFNLKRTSESPSFSQKFASSFQTLKEKTNSKFRATQKAAKELGSQPIKQFNKTFDSIKNKNFFQIFSLRQAAPVFAVLLILLIAPGPAKSYYLSLKSTTDSVALDGTKGFTALQDSTAALLAANLPSAELSTTEALRNFNSALNTLEEKHRLLQKIISIIPVLHDEVKSRQNLILAGQKITLGNTYLLKGIEESQSNPNETLTKRLDIIITHLSAALPNYEQATTYLDTVSPDDLPVEYQASFKEFKKLFTTAIADFKQIDKLGESFQDIFGAQGSRRYLLVFQNTDELRPTGGFMGSFAEIDLKDGKVEKINIPAGGTYDLQGQLEEYVEPPTPFFIANKRWEFQDANWFPDFKTSAEKILWFYRHSERGSADGVIAINSSVLKRLLALMGPITDEKRNIKLTSETALADIQAVVEEGPEKKDNKPKQIISDLAPQFLDYFKNIKPDQILPLLSSFKEALDQKEIQVYFADSQIEKQIQPFGWTGDIINIPPNEDYLMVVNTNIRGQKSDARIKQKISHQAVVQDDGSIIDTVTISREHTGQISEKFYGQPNINYMRVYTPKGSELLSATGFKWPDEKSFRAPDSWTKKDETLALVETEVATDPISGTKIVNEFDKTSFGNWVITEPGETNVVQFSYRIPYKISISQNAEGWKKLISSAPTISPYHLTVQRQSGSESTFDSQIIFPAGWSPISSDGSGIEIAANGAAITEANLTNDSRWSIAMKKTDK